MLYNRFSIFTFSKTSSFVIFLSLDNFFTFYRTYFIIEKVDSFVRKQNTTATINEKGDLKYMHKGA